MYKLRVYMTVPYLQPQFVAWLSSPTRARGYPPSEGDHSLFIEIEPALAIHKIADIAIKSSPTLEFGMLYTERQFGLLELHAKDKQLLEVAGDNILTYLNVEKGQLTPPKVLYSDIVENINDQHAIILNRTREASMIIPGESLLVYELTPALYAGLAANEALKFAEVKLIHVDLIGASGRIFMSGSFQQLKKAQIQMDNVLQ
ncbi:MAG: hypothetical protein QM538_05280 [Methylacidiphilales bacterium]|nr:hypothetical protein [Candidatus Methylacidiphilales bacterium]